MITAENIIEFPPSMARKAKQVADMLKALGHEHRMLILCLLADGEKSVIELENLLSMRQPSVSQQLARLRADNLVNQRRDGKTIYYSIADKKTLRLIKLLYEMYCGQDDE